ncbi:MAG TPA: serine/threonine-protein kinase, partial [Terriglobales bacterium]|nr:serine/threonine-protein kinase [Terriglobales bacterium]
MIQPIDGLTDAAYHPRMAAEAPVTGAVLGHYRIVEKIGEGGMGVVFRARDERLDRDVAIKVLPPGTFPDETGRKRFRREAQILAKVHHANIVMAFDFGHQNGVDYLVTEYVPGTTLDTRIAQGPLPQKLVVELGIQLARGLAAAHRERITHGDLKPGNLRLAETGELKILDFGLARWHQLADDAALTASLQDASKVAGTLPYM